ncbi:MAG TPA: FHA domain-containing protein [Kofleriaceae bacterium]|nr:FHA domain-containing protein [Kofleriaceae bacterium]
MLAIHYCRQDERTKRFTTDCTPVAIGRAAGNDLVLVDPGVSDHHCRLSERDLGWVVDDLGSERGTLVNGRRITATVMLGAHDRIYVGPFVLQLEEIDERLPPVEAGLLDGIARGDDNSRTIYADWLEERGDVAHAEFLRVQQSIIDDPMDTPARQAVFLARSKRLRTLAESIDVEWRMRVARPAVEGCRVAFEIPCKMDWGMLEPTDRPEVRTCNTCRKNVRYCVHEEDALEFAGRGHCIVVDIRPVGLTCARCGHEVPRSSAVCAGCGAPRPVTLPAAPPHEQQLRAVTAGRMVVVPPAAFRGDSDDDSGPRYAMPGMVAVGRAVYSIGAARVCGSCHAENPAAFRFCATCGQPLAHAPRAG